MFFDPRSQPVKGIKSYPEYIKNAVVNFCSSNNCTIPLLQTTTPVDMYGFNRDHHYLKDTQSECFRQHKKSTAKTPAAADHIEEKTVNLEPKWRNERLNRIHSSMFWENSQVSVEAKANLAKDFIHYKEFTSKCTDRGIKNELKTITTYEELQKTKVRHCDIIICMDHPYLFFFFCATSDGLVGDDVVLEVKCPYIARKQPIGPKTVPYLKENND